MNKLGFGFLRLPMVDGKVNFEMTNMLADAFLASGGRYFDTCYTYLDGQSEEAIRRCVSMRYPRDCFEIADKIPGYLCKTEDDMERFLKEELKRCGVEYFDVLMLHWLNGKNYETAQTLHQFEFLARVKKENRARRIGFSYHDSASLLERILTEHPDVDVVQIQLNYLDWNSAGIESRACYEVCVRHGKSVIVMEPIKGGTLAAIPENAMTPLRKMHPDWSPADWALRFAQSQSQVEIVLSGMNTPEQIAANSRQFESFSPAETELLLSVVPVIEGSTAVPCTACRYCETHCPENIAIPDYFKMYNEVCRFPDEDWKIAPSYAQLANVRGRASSCIACGACAAHCPQKIAIPEYIKKVAMKFE